MSDFEMDFNDYIDAAEAYLAQRDEARAQLAARDQRIAELEAALRQYANHDNWGDESDESIYSRRFRVQQDGWEIARKALAGGAS